MDGMDRAADGAGGAGLAFGVVESPIGPLSLAVTDRGLLRLAFGRVPAPVLRSASHDPGGVTAPLPLAEHRYGVQITTELAEYFAGRRRIFSLPIDWSLSAEGAQREILQTLYTQVPFGRTVNYGELALRAGRTLGASRLVGTVMGSNPIAVVVPCHRVLAADGLGGFGGGLDTKRDLLTLEGVLQEALF